MPRGDPIIRTSPRQSQPAAPQAIKLTSPAVYWGVQTWIRRLRSCTAVLRPSQPALAKSVFVRVHLWFDFLLLPAPLTPGAERRRANPKNRTEPHAQRYARRQLRPPAAHRGKTHAKRYAAHRRHDGDRSPDATASHPLLVSTPSFGRTPCPAVHGSPPASLQPRNAAKPSHTVRHAHIPRQRDEFADLRRQ